MGGLCTSDECSAVSSRLPLLLALSWLCYCLLRLLTPSLPPLPPPSDDVDTDTSTTQHPPATSSTASPASSMLAGEVAAAGQVAVAASKSAPLAAPLSASSRFEYTYDLNEDLERLMALEEQLGMSVDLQGLPEDTQVSEGSLGQYLSCGNQRSSLPLLRHTLHSTARTTSFGMPVCHSAIVA